MRELGKPSPPDTEGFVRFVKDEVATEIDRHLPWLIRVVFRAFSRAQTPEQGAARASECPKHSLTDPASQKQISILKLEATVAYCIAADVVSGGFYAQCTLTDVEGR